MLLGRRLRTVEDLGEERIAHDTESDRLEHAIEGRAMVETLSAVGGIHAGVGEHCVEEPRMQTPDAGHVVLAHF